MNNSFLELIQRLLTGFVDQFKMKNPVAFTIIAVVLGIAYFTAGQLIDATTPEGESLFPDNIDAIIGQVRGWIVFALALLGAHTPDSAQQKTQGVNDQVQARTEADFEGYLSSMAGITQADANRLSPHIFNALIEDIRDNGISRQRKFGAFEVKRIPAREGTGPNGDPVSFPAYNRVYFRAYAPLLKAINPGTDQTVLLEKAESEEVTV